MSAQAVASVQPEPAGWESAWLASHDNPLLFATGVLGFALPDEEAADGQPQLEQWQFEFLRDFYLDARGRRTDGPRHSVRAGHGVGKGVIGSILALWFPLTHYDSKCVITANSQDQLRDNNWAELKKWHGELPAPLREKLQVDAERMFVTAAPEMAFVVRRTASKANPEALQGVHAKHVLFLVDEASGMADIVFEVAQGSMSTPGAITCLFSNPTRSAGFFYDTHHRLRDHWRCKRVSSEDVPRARGHIQEIIDGYGANSNKYRVRVLGEFPTADDDTVIPLELIEAAVGRDVAARDVEVVWGVDVARFGDDASALAKRQGNVLLEPVKEWRQRDTMQLAGLIAAEWVATDEKIRPGAILIDVIGIGAGVVDRLREVGLPVFGVNVAESAAVDDKYFRLRDELWFAGRAWFAARDCRIPEDAALVSELAVVSYDFHSNGSYVVESKKSLKKRGVPSPNKADAFLNTFARPERRRGQRPRRDARGGVSSWAA